jgi:hypothetical protein
MRHLKPIAIALLASLALAASAQAAELTGAEIKDTISGKSVYLQTMAGSVTGTPGQGVIYYAADGTALYKTPMGVIWHGTWAIKDNTNCTTYKEAAKPACSKYDKQGDVISLINTETGQLRAKILKVVPGNAENLAP